MGQEGGEKMRGVGLSWSLGDRRGETWDGEVGTANNVFNVNPYI